MSGEETLKTAGVSLHFTSCARRFEDLGNAAVERLVERLPRLVHCEPLD